MISSGRSPEIRAHYHLSPHEQTAQLLGRFLSAMEPKSKIPAIPFFEVVDRIRSKGVRRSARLGLDIIRTQASSRARPAKRQFVFISHPIDTTGAPQVLVAAAEEFARRYGGRNIRIVAPTVAPDQQERLDASDIRFDKAAVMGPRLVKLQLNLRRDDFVLMNTAAVYEVYQRTVLRALRQGQLGHAFWFIHEDVAQLSVVAPAFENQAFRDLVAQQVEAGRLTIVVPSIRIKRQYDGFLGTAKVAVVDLKVDVGAEFGADRPIEDYARVSFLLSGSSTDGRKGQLLAALAFQTFHNLHYRRDPSAYRDFELVLVGVGTDYVSRQLTTIVTSTLGEHAAIHPQVSHGDALAIARRSNAVFCCAFNEAFPLYVAEGMAMSHVVVRNDVGGVEEQLEEGVNGYLLDGTDIAQMAGVIEQILNLETTSDRQLWAMGAASRRLIAPYRKSSYLKSLEALEKSRG